MLRGAELIEQGRAMAPKNRATTAFLRLHGAASEAEYKLRCRAQRRTMYHMHVGLSTWAQTEQALVEVSNAMAAEGFFIDRFGLALDRAMGVLESDRDLTAKETGPRLGPGEWSRLGEAAPIQPHMGDFMIGFPSGFTNTLRALEAGVTTIGNIGQFTAFDLIGGSDEILVTEETVRALGAISALRNQGVLAHSNLDDGSSTQARHFGGYVGWAALELYVVEELTGARLAHCFGNTIENPESRAIVHFALDDIRGRDSIGSMIYGNTADYRVNSRARNTAVLSAQIMCDIAMTIRRPTGHAVNPVPLSEAERIPSAAEIVEAHLLARELEREVRKAPDLYHWERLEHAGALVAEYAMEFRNRALAMFAADGIDTTDAAHVLLALRRTTMQDLERRLDFSAPPEVARLETWKAKHVRELTDRLRPTSKPLDRMRIVLAVLEVHDLVRDALAATLPAAGAEVILLGSNTPIEGLVRSATNEDADAIVLGVYNGNALALGQQLMSGLSATGWDGRVFMGGLLNQDIGDGLPIDARPDLRALGIQCVDRAEDLVALLTAS